MYMYLSSGGHGPRESPIQGIDSVNKPGMTYLIGPVGNISYLQFLRIEQLYTKESPNSLPWWRIRVLSFLPGFRSLE